MYKNHFYVIVIHDYDIVLSMNDVQWRYTRVWYDTNDYIPWLPSLHPWHYWLHLTIPTSSYSYDMNGIGDIDGIGDGIGGDRRYEQRLDIVVPL